MKWFSFLLMITVTSLSAATVCTDSLGNAARDLSGLPMGWRHYATEIQGQTGTRQITTVQGKPAVVMKDDGPGEIGFFREFDVPEGRYWHASIQAALPKGARANDAFVLQLTFLGGKSTSQAVRLEVGKQTFEQFDLYMQAPAGARKVRCYIYSHKPHIGAVAVRDLKIETSSKQIGRAHV